MSSLTRRMTTRGSTNDLMELYFISARYAQTTSDLKIAIAGAGMLLERFLLVILELYYVVSACFIQIPVIIIPIKALVTVLGVPIARGIRSMRAFRVRVRVEKVLLIFVNDFPILRHSAAQNVPCRIDLDIAYSQHDTSRTKGEVEVLTASISAWVPP